MLKGVSNRDAVQTFEAGMTFQEYIADFRVHRDELVDHHERLAGIVSELQNNPPLSNVRVLAISEDWCPDCVFNVPIVARFVEASRGSSLRIVRRPEYVALADTYPGRGGISRVPTFIFLDQSDDVIGHWSERCASSHRWFKTFTKDHPMPQLSIKNGIPAPPLVSWMKLRIASERDRFYRGVWRDVLSEIQVILSKSRVHGNDV
jgi:thioredoxin family protein